MTLLLHNLLPSGSQKPSQPAARSNYNTIDELIGSTGDITFDGIYKNVYQHRDVLAQELVKGRRIILFIMGKYVGGDNSFDHGMPLEQYCTWEELNELHELGCEIGWHTWTHPDLTTLSYEQILKEVTPQFPMDFFAYPYGRINDTCIKAVQEAGYKEAWSVFQGDNSQFQRRRSYICN